MRPFATTTVATYCLLALAGGVSFMLPNDISVPSIQARPLTTDSVRLTGIVRDFKDSHPDFGGITQTGGNGHVAGNIASTLGEDGRPVFIGISNSGGPVSDFNLSSGTLQPKEEYGAMVTIIGAAIMNGTYDAMVTVRAQVGSQTIDPFGAYDKALAGNVNKAGNPRKYVHSQVFSANTPVNISATSWIKKSASYNGTSESHWKTYMSASSNDGTQQVRVLRNGDPCPTTPGFQAQLAAKQFLVDFVNPTTQKMVLNPNQVIYLFELGTTSMTSAAADFQDLVVLVTLGSDTTYLSSLDAYGDGGSNAPKFTGYKVASQWRDSASHPIAPGMFNNVSSCGAVSDIAGSKGVASTGGITSADSFSQWFSDAMGVNMSSRHTLELVRNSSGAYEYHSDAFHPIDDQLMGNEGSAHNNYFTYSIRAEFVHHACTGTFFEFSGSDDAWLFVDGKLVMDLGGLSAGTTQYVDMNRLGLSDGATHELELFYAQRLANSGAFHIRTNLPLAPSDAPYSVNASFD